MAMAMMMEEDTIKRKKRGCYYYQDCILIACVLTIFILFALWSFLALLQSYGQHNLIIPFRAKQKSIPNNNNNNNSEDMEGDQEGEGGIPRYYPLGSPIRDWDAQRARWLRSHSPRGNSYRLVVLSGSGPGPCPAAMADHLLLRSLKNKADYCRIQGCSLFYNTALLDPAMDTFWAKLPLLRSAMLAHPEAEWLWWVDSDAVITDMSFRIPLRRYDRYNMAVHGWEDLVFHNRSWVGLNAGSFLIRNCQWTLRFLERWASMGPAGPIRHKSGKIQSDLLPDRPKDWPGDDQSALIYLMIKERQQWANKIYIENAYYLNGYWRDLVSSLDNRTSSASASAYAETDTPIASDMNRTLPFITHFAGCQICTGRRNPLFGVEECQRGMEKALNFADNQVLASYGFRHPSLHDAGVKPSD